MRSRGDIVAYIDRSGLSFRDVDDKTWILRTAAGEENIVVRLADPLLLFRVKVMELEGVQDRAGLFGKLLELNASDLVHSSYGVADNAVVMSSALLLAFADYNEFQSALDEIGLALTNHYEALGAFNTQSG